MSVPSLCDEYVFSKVFRTYSKTLFNFLYYHCGDEALAEDITQEAFLKLWKNCSKVVLATAEGYVFRTAKNQLLNVFDRQKVKLRFLSGKFLDRTNQNPEFLLEEKEFKIQLEEAISALPVKQREVFLMSRIDKMTYKTIAKTLGISQKAVEKRMYKALDMLRKISINIK